MMEYEEIPISLFKEEQERDRQYFELVKQIENSW